MSVVTACGFQQQEKGERAQKGRGEREREGEEDKRREWADALGLPLGGIDYKFR